MSNNHWIDKNYVESLGLKRRSELHWARKIWHIVGVSLIAVIHSQVTYNIGIFLLLIFLTLTISIDLSRQFLPALNDLILHLFRPILRKTEVSHLTGNSFLILGVSLVHILFPYHIVSLTLLFLAFADPIASIIGVKYGKDKIVGNKSLQGFIAAFLVCFVASILYFYAHGLMLNRLVIVSLTAGLIGALAELIPIGKLDDNLTLPLLSSCGLYFIFYLFGGL